jgi:hypothetical protein
LLIIPKPMMSLEHVAVPPQHSRAIEWRNKGLKCESLSTTPLTLALNSFQSHHPIQLPGVFPPTMTTFLRASMRVGDHCWVILPEHHVSSLRLQDTKISSEQSCTNSTDSKVSPNYDMNARRPPDRVILQTFNRACSPKQQQQCGSPSQ